MKAALVTTYFLDMASIEPEKVCLSRWGGGLGCVVGLRSPKQ